MLLQAVFKTGMVEFVVNIPKVQASGNFKSKAGVTGPFTSDLTNITGVVQVSIKPGSSREPNFVVLHCSSTATFNTIFR